MPVPRIQEFKYKRNLKHHISEKHINITYWLCTEENCKRKFLRREYLWRHLSWNHNFTRSDAKLTALYARRVNEKDYTSSYYEDVSSDDDFIFDLPVENGELNDINGVLEKVFDPTYMVRPATFKSALLCIPPHRISNFSNLPFYHVDVTLYIVFNNGRDLIS